MEEAEAQKNEVRKKEQWLQNFRFSCVKCAQTFNNREELMTHYDRTRHDKYSDW